MSDTETLTPPTEEKQTYTADITGLRQAADEHVVTSETEPAVEVKASEDAGTDMTVKQAASELTAPHSTTVARHPRSDLHNGEVRVPGLASPDLAMREDHGETWTPRLKGLVRSRKLECRE